MNVLIDCYELIKRNRATSFRNGFHIVEPDPEKRAKLLQSTKRQEEAYKSYLSQRPARSTSSSNNKLGGTRFTNVHEAREQFLSRVAPTKTQRLVNIF